MNISALQIILIFVVAFIAAIDQFDLTQTLYQPIIVAPIIGAILGEATIGLAVGGTYQLISIGSMPVGGAQPPNVVIGGIVATIFAVTAGFDVETSVGMAIPFSVLGQMLVTLIFTLRSPIMQLADKAAEKGESAAITRITLTQMLILGSAFGLVAVLAAIGGEPAGAAIQKLFDNYAWLQTGFNVAGGMLRYVGFAVLMRIMLSGDLWGYYFAGFAAATIVGSIPSLAGSALLLLAFIGVAIAIAEYQNSVKMKSLGGSGNGGFEDGI